MNVRQIYELALALMDFSAQKEEFPLETVAGMMTVLANEVLAVSNRMTGQAVQAPVFEKWTDEVPFAGIICQSVLPYALAAKLTLEDDPAKSGSFTAEYLYRLGQYCPAAYAAVEAEY